MDRDNRAFWLEKLLTVFSFMVIAHGLDRFGNFSHYTYSTISPDVHSFAFLLILCSLFSHPVYLAFIIPTLNLLGYFYFPSLVLSTRPFHMIFCQTFKRSLSRLTYTPHLHPHRSSSHLIF